MFVQWKLIIISFIGVETQSYVLRYPDFSPDYFHSSSEFKSNLRRTFLESRRQNLVTKKRVELIDKYLLNNSVFIDGIMHERIDEKHKQKNLVIKLEDAFKDLVGMNGVKYSFKRDSFWRTWRKVAYPDGDKMVCYRCEGSFNCTNCQNIEFWAIEENPPCPYEITSLINNTDVCAINFKNSTNVKGSCPFTAQFTDIMRECDNPIDTQWRIQRSYKKEISERYPAIFCDGRDFCEISTLYTITPDYVSFRVINSTNHITYSKIMKNNKTNYACVRDCGTIDPKTKIVSKTGQPLIVDLINSKNKREDKTQSSNQTTTVFNGITNRGNESSTVSDKTTNERVKFKLNKLKHSINEMEKAFDLPGKNVVRTDDGDGHIFHHHHHRHDEKHPTCSSMKHHMEEELSEEISTFY